MALVTNDPKWITPSLGYPVSVAPVLGEVVSPLLVLQAVYIYDPSNPPVPSPMGPVGYPIVNG